MRLRTLAQMWQLPAFLETTEMKLDPCPKCGARGVFDPPLQMVICGTCEAIYRLVPDGVYETLVTKPALRELGKHHGWFK